MIIKQAVTQIAATAVAAGSLAVAPHTSAAERHRHFDPTSVSAVSRHDWWVLGRGGVVHTTDGGDHFTRATGRHHDDRIMAASPSTIYLAGPRLVVTHDGGATWHRVQLGGRVSAVVSADGYAYATVGGRRTSVVKRSAIGSDTWTKLRTPGKQATIEWADASYVFAVSCIRHPRAGCQRLLVSADHGATWKRRHLPIEELNCDVQQVKPPVLWEHCATGMMSNVWRSRHNGAHFYAPQHHDGLGAAMTNGASFAAASNRTAFVASFEIRRTTNAGRAWHEVGPKPRRNAWWSSIAFSDRRHGFAIRMYPRHSQLWRTHDAGVHWHRAHLPQR